MIKEHIFNTVHAVHTNFEIIDSNDNWLQLAFLGAFYTAISINVVGSKIQAYATRPNGSVDRSRRLLHLPNTNEV